LGRLNQDFQTAGAEILVILGDTIVRARSYAELLHVPFPILADPDRAIYHRYNLERAIFGLQRTASVVVDRHGVIQYLQRVTNPMAWLQDSHELLEFVAGLGGKDA
jgi:peroxiredoxin